MGHFGLTLTGPTIDIVLSCLQQAFLTVFTLLAYGGISPFF